jgi:hypothetical protein
MNEKNMEKPLKTMADLVAEIEAKRAAGILPKAVAIRMRKLETLDEGMRDDMMSYAAHATIDQVREGRERVIEADVRSVEKVEAVDARKAIQEIGERNS